MNIRDQSPQQIQMQKFPTNSRKYQMTIHHDQVGFISQMHGWFDIHKSKNVKNYTNVSRTEITWSP